MGLRYEHAAKVLEIRQHQRAALKARPEDFEIVEGWWGEVWVFKPFWERMAQESEARRQLIESASRPGGQSGREADQGS